MASPLPSFVATEPRGLASSAPRTPEPSVEGQDQLPTPSQLRFRLKRRNVSHRRAPTPQFLASVAAADVPIQSIEEPRVLDDMIEATTYPGIANFNSFDDISFQEQAARGRAFSTPKTPTPRAVPSLSPKRFPDWSIEGPLSSIESSPECEDSRPSTARSTQTSASLFSRYSLTSEDLSQCASPEDEPADRFGPSLHAGEADRTIKASTRPTALRKAPWTRAMSQHVWSTYMMYLQDPKVTPFRVGRSGIPPSGVCVRVSREARRSWKGSRSQAKAQTKADSKSGSTTPKAEAAAPYIEWPHTCAATRGHLRELCKANSATAGRNMRYLANSPTPFGKTANRFWNRRSAPLRSPSVFSGTDMAMSLTVCTSDSMQPQGPLAKLTSSQPGPSVGDPHRRLAPSFVEHASREQERSRLGSPFTAKSYGPSSSNPLAAFGLGAEAHKQNHTISSRRSLGSPVRLDESRSNTQKRRSRQCAMGPRKCKRPSLGSDFWTDPSAKREEPAASSSFPEFCSTKPGVRDSISVPRTNVLERFEASRHCPSQSWAAGMSIDDSRIPPVAAPPRLGSPFAGKSQSFSFPNRHSTTASIDFAADGRPFATVHQPFHGATRSTKPSLASLAYIDERLKDFRRWNPRERRSRSPN